MDVSDRKKNLKNLRGGEYQQLKKKDLNNLRNTVSLTVRGIRSFGELGCLFQTSSTVRWDLERFENL